MPGLRARAGAAAARAAARPRAPAAAPARRRADRPASSPRIYSDANVAWNGPFASIPCGGADRDRDGRRARSASPCWPAAAPWSPGVAGAVLALAIAAVGWARQDDYFAHRYDRPEDFRFQLDDAVRWAKPTSGPADRRGGNQRRLQPVRLLRRRPLQLRPVRRPPPPRGRLPRDRQAAPTSAEAVNDGDYDYLVTTPDAGPQQSRHRPHLARAGLGDRRSRGRGGRALGPRLGVPDPGELVPTGCGNGEPARPRGNREDRLRPK